MDPSDPPGHLDRTWHNDGRLYAPWIARDVGADWVDFSLVKHGGELHVRHHTISYRFADIGWVDA